MYAKSILLLPPHEHRYRAWKLLKLIGLGKSGAVYSVKLDNQRYTLKVFWPYEPDLDFDPRLRGIHHALRYDSFLSECRAYGQIQAGEKMDMVPTCHGYIAVPFEIAQRISNDLIRRCLKYLVPPGPNEEPLNAILLDFVDGHHVGPADVDAEFENCARQQVERLHDRGIIHGDLKSGNILITTGGIKLIDFASAFTIPHPTFPDECLARQQFQKMQKRDFNVLSETIEELLTDARHTQRIR